MHYTKQVFYIKNNIQHAVCIRFIGCIALFMIVATKRCQPLNLNVAYINKYAKLAKFSTAIP